MKQSPNERMRAVIFDALKQNPCTMEQLIAAVLKDERTSRLQKVSRNRIASVMSCAYWKVEKLPGKRYKLASNR